MIEELGITVTKVFTFLVENGGEKDVEFTGNRLQAHLWVHLSTGVSLYCPPLQNKQIYLKNVGGDNREKRL